jgi:hypothetical protein
MKIYLHQVPQCVEIRALLHFVLQCKKHTTGDLSFSNMDRLRECLLVQEQRVEGGCGLEVGQ